MKVLVRKFPDGSRSYLCTRTVGDHKVAHYFVLRDGQKLSEADMLGARKGLEVELLRQMRVLAGQVNPGKEG